VSFGFSEEIERASETEEIPRMLKGQCPANPSEMPPNFAQVVLPDQTMHMEGDLLLAGENILRRC
jgi:hypothetical protein